MSNTKRKSKMSHTNNVKSFNGHAVAAAAAATAQATTAATGNKYAVAAEQQTQLALAATTAPVADTPALTAADGTPGQEQLAKQETVPQVEKENVAKGIILEDKPDFVVPTLLTGILSRRRAYNSKGDKNFRTWLVEYIGKTLKTPVRVDGAGNILATVDVKSDIMFSCHTDTCHGTKESDEDKPQALCFDPTFGHLFLEDQKTCGVLGADDGAGVYLMLEMIKAKVPAKYIFHAGEERGGIGSKAFVLDKKNAEFIDDLSAVIALDRHCRGAPEVITHQGGRECASKITADWIASQLNQVEFDFSADWKQSSGGVYTDSKEYASLVPECLNLTVFYDKQHSPQEVLDVFELEKLRRALIAIDWHAMPIQRKPAPAAVYQPYDGNYGASKSWMSNAASAPAATKADKPKATKAAVAAAVVNGIQGRIDELEGCALPDLQDWVEAEPDAATITIAALLAEVKSLQVKVQVLSEVVGI